MPKLFHAYSLSRNYMKNLLKKWFFVMPQFIIPHHLLSRLILKLTRLQMGMVTHWIIKRFIKFYNVDMSIVQSPQAHDYKSFNQFFTRALKPTARPLAQTDIICPVDAKISQIGKIEQGTLLQAKEHSFQLVDLLGGDTKMATQFNQGLFCTLYLSPKDYHRIHMPITGRLTDMIYVPGRLFSVNQTTTQAVSNLFARNERVICLFETDLGAMALVLVGALFVGCMETVWAGTVTPNSLATVEHWNYPEQNVLQCGAEMGRFNMGSTVIVLLEDKHLTWLSGLAAHNNLLMGQGLACKK